MKKTVVENEKKGGLYFLEKTGFFRQAILKNVTETNPDVLKQLFEQAKKDNPSLALAYAEQAAIYGGIEGLLLYIKFRKKIVLLINSDEENRQTPTTNLLSFIYLAKKLLPQDHPMITQLQSYENELINTCEPPLDRESIQAALSESENLFNSYFNDRQISFNNS